MKGNQTENWAENAPDWRDEVAESYRCLAVEERDHQDNMDRLARLSA